MLATQNPIEQEGTYPLPEAQVDRFMLKVVIDYPKLEEEKLIIRQNINGDKFEVKPILKADEIIEARKVVRQVYLDEKIEKYIVDIVFATRYPEKYDLKELKDMIGFGGSPRASKKKITWPWLPVATRSSSVAVMSFRRMCALWHTTYFATVSA